jgi:hypothetical protein
VRTRLYYSAALVLAIGLASALAIYFTAEDEPETGASYVIVDGKVYAIPYSASRTYVRRTMAGQVARYERSVAQHFRGAGPFRRRAAPAARLEGSLVP